MTRSPSTDAFPGRPTVSGQGFATPIGLSPVLAHQGGWDEILLVVAPLVVIGGLLWLANRRVTAQLREEAAVTEETMGGAAMEGATAEGADGTAETTGPDVASGHRPPGDDGQD